MGSLSVQPPSGIDRNVTEVFLFLRNDSRKKEMVLDFGGSDDRVALIEFETGNGGKAPSYSKAPPPWVNILDESNYELTRVRTRMTTLKGLQQKHLTRDFDKEHSPDQKEIEDLPEEIMKMFTHCRRLIRSLEEADHERSPTLGKLRQNLVASLLLSLNNHLCSFRENQSTYLRQLDSRAKNVNSFLLTSSANHQSHPLNPIEDMDFGNNDSEELTIDQIQQIAENEHMTKEREKEVLKIGKSILELNIMFKDIASLIMDQGTVVDRIDYNVEQTSIRVKTATQHVEKAAERQKQNKKMQLIVVLAAIAIVLMLLIILTKL